MGSKLFLVFIFSFFFCASALSQEKPKSDEFTEISKALEPSSQPTDIQQPVMLELASFDDANITGLETKINELRITDTPIIIRINTNGGSIGGMMNLIQFLEKSPVTCVSDYRSYSAGNFFLESPACKVRQMTKRATLLFHEALTSSAEGNSHALRDTAEILEKLSNGIFAFTSERLGMTEEEFKAKVDNKIWALDYHDALKYHAVDSIVDPKDLPPVTPFEKPKTLFDLLNLSPP